VTTDQLPAGLDVDNSTVDGMQGRAGSSRVLARPVAGARETVTRLAWDQDYTAFDSRVPDNAEAVAQSGISAAGRRRPRDPRGSPPVVSITGRMPLRVAPGVLTGGLESPAPNHQRMAASHALVE
jgi:hypothetical protein